MDLVDYRGIERLVIVIGAVVCAWLGYNLFKKRTTLPGRERYEFRSPCFNIIFSGAGPGLALMFTACVVLVSMSFSKVTKAEERSKASAASSASSQPEYFEANNRALFFLIALQHSKNPEHKEEYLEQAIKVLRESVKRPIVEAPERSTSETLHVIETGSNSDMVKPAQPR